MSNVFTRIEVNALDGAVHPTRISEFVVRYSCPAIVTLPHLVAPFIVDRLAKRGAYKIIAAVGFDNDRHFGMQKLRELHGDAMAADGFDIVVTKDISHIQAYNEIKSLTEFLKTVNPLAEIRWVLDVFSCSDDDLYKYLDAIKKYPAHFIRMDRRLSHNGITIDAHKSKYDLIRKHVMTPIKASCNITAEVIANFMSDRTMRFDVTLSQANDILRHISNPQNVNMPKNEDVQSGVDNAGHDDYDIDNNSCVGNHCKCKHEDDGGRSRCCDEEGCGW
ncbi:MAG: hypothetical protein QXU32_00555 [Nitrososphaerales archaeon]